MLSVKHIQLSGREDIYLAKHVAFQPEYEPLKGPTNSSGRVPPTILMVRDDDSVLGLSGGTVFVMNEVGKTVSRYDIGASMVPPDERRPAPDAVRLS